jgi:hypothetical protein
MLLVYILENLCYNLFKSVFISYNTYTHMRIIETVKIM